MAVPKKRLTSTRSGNRRAHQFIKTSSFSLCPKCGKSVIPHTVCLNCGTYKGKTVLDLDKKEKKKIEASESAA